MKNVRRTLSALLALLTVSGIFASCAQNPSGTVPSDDTTASETTTQAPETTAKTYTPDLPEKNFNGKELKALTFQKSSAAITDLCAYETMGEPLNDAIYKRNSTIEERYKIDLVIDEQVKNDCKKIVESALLAHEDRWGFLDIAIRETVQFASAGYLHDLVPLNYIDPEAEWWDQRCREEMSILGKVFFLIGDINLFAASETYGLIFNKEVAEAFEVGDLYPMVHEGKWTIDALYTMITKVAGDVDGNGVMDQNDRYGLYTQNDMMNFYNGAGVRIALKDKDDVPYLVGITDRGIGALEKGHKIMSDANTVFAGDQRNKTIGAKSIYTEIIIPAFKNNLGLFYSTGIGNTYKNLRDMEAEYGIVPIPKYDEAQEEYYCGLLESWATVVSIPKTASDPDFPAFILEALSAESVLTVTKTWNEQCFNTKGVRDEESIHMAELIAKSRCYDIGYFFGWGNIGKQIKNQGSAATMNFASNYASLESKAQLALEDTLKLFKSNT